MALTDKLTAIADAIRSKTGGTEALTLDGMAEAVAGLETGGEDTLAAMIGGTLTEYASDDITAVRDYAFYYCDSIEEISLPNVKSVGKSAFSNCAALASVNLPNVTSLTGTSPFSYCSALTSIDLPEVVSLPRYAFQGCSALASVNLPKVASLGGNTFSNCAFTSIHLPSLTTMGSSEFSCKKLETVRVPSLSSITGSNVFNGCSNLTAFVIEQTDSVCTMAYSGIFTTTPIASGTGYVYVPDALVGDYKAATNWSTYADQIKPLSEYVEVTE